jgi:VHL beta domain
MTRAILLPLLTVIGLLTGSSATTGFGQTTNGTTRQTTDQPDAVNGYQVHVIYAVPKGGTDKQIDVNGTLELSVRTTQNWFASQTAGKRLRFDTISSGTLDVSFLALQRTEAEFLAEIAEGRFVLTALEAEVLGAGFDQPNKLYVVFYQGSSKECGGGPWPPKLFGSVVGIFLGPQLSHPEFCQGAFTRNDQQPKYTEFVMLHEIFHGLGAVPDCAPHHTRAGHTSDSTKDLMYAGDLPGQVSVLDLGRDDYYGHGRKDCLDMARSAFLEPAVPGAEPPPTWPITNIPTTPCWRLAGLRSMAGAAVRLQIVNARRRAVNVFWVNSNGVEQASGSIRAGNRTNLSTFASNPFVFRDADGTCVGAIVAGPVLGRGVLR